MVELFQMNWNFLLRYCAMKILPYQNEEFYVVYVKNIETNIKSGTVMSVLKQLIQRQGYHL